MKKGAHSFHSVSKAFHWRNNFLIFFLHCVCYLHFWELSALCVVPETSCMTFRCINCETGEKEIDSHRKVQQKIIAGGFHREQREKTIHGNLQKDISMITFWFVWCLIIGRAPLSRVSREKRGRVWDKIRWRGLVANHFHNFHLPALSFCIFVFLVEMDGEVRTQNP